MGRQTIQRQSPDSHLFSDRDLFLLFLPVMAEQGLEYLIGMIDSLMAAQISEAAVSGVSLVDFVMAFMISLFTALAAGGVTIIGQYMGKGNPHRAGDAACQFVKTALVTGILSAFLLFAIRRSILHVLFGAVSEDVYAAASIYYDIMLWSIPFLALYNAGAGLFQSAGNARFPMKVMLCTNGLHILGNAFCLFILHMGVEGVAYPSLLSRIGAAFLILGAACRASFPFCIRCALTSPVDASLIRQILSIGIPFGLENGMFYLGRLIVLSIVALFGTAAIAANAVAGILSTFINLPGMAITLALLVIISRCTGAGRMDDVRYYTRKTALYMHTGFLLSSAVVLSATPSFLHMYQLSPEAVHLTWIIILSLAAGHILIWPAGYMLPVVFRSVGDARSPCTFPWHPWCSAASRWPISSPSHSTWACLAPGPPCSSTGSLRPPSTSITT